MEQSLHITEVAAAIALIPSGYLKEVPPGFSQERPYSGFAVGREQAMLIQTGML